jgi:hypothetical protein
LFPRLGRRCTILTGLTIFIGLLVTGPITNGWIIDLAGGNYNMILALAPFFMLLALLLMLGVRKGEALAGQA